VSNEVCREVTWTKDRPISGSIAAKDIGCSAALVLVVGPSRLSAGRGDRNARVLQQLLTGFVEAYLGSRRVVRAVVDVFSRSTISSASRPSVGVPISTNAMGCTPLEPMYALTPTFAGSRLALIRTKRVIVDFLGGDPDRPIVVGSVYNGFNHPPFALPQNQTQSGIKSQSTTGGNTATANVIRFEDKIGSEQLYIQAEKDKDVLVKANRTAKIGDSDELEIKNDRTKKIGQNETIDVGANRKATIVGNDTTTITGNQDTTVTGNVTQTVTGNVTQTVTGSVTETIAGSRTETIAGALTQTAVGGVTITTPAAVTIAATGGFTVVAPAGTKTIDSFFDKTGGFTSDAFGAKLSIVGAKTDLVAGLALSLVNNKVDVVGMKVDLTRTKIANQNQVTLKSYGTAIMQGYVNLHGCTLFVVG
jgi:hypothetical protein